MATEIKIDLNASEAIRDLKEVEKKFTTLVNQTEKFNNALSSAGKSSFQSIIQGANLTQQAMSKVAFQTKGAVEIIQKDLPDSLNNTARQVNLLDEAYKKIGTTIAGVFAVNKIVGFFSDAISEAQKFENALIGINSVAKATGNNVDEVGIAVKKLAEDGLVPVNEVASSLKNLLASGLNLDQSVKLFNALKDSAAFNRQGFLSLGEAVTGATQGIKNGISVLVDNAGITKNLSILEKEYAESIGTTVGKLTEAERIQARYVGILKESAIFTGDAEKLTTTYAGSIARLSATFSIFLSNIGSLVTKSTLVGSSLKFLTDQLSFINTLASGTDPSEKIKKIREALNKLSSEGKQNSAAYALLASDLEKLSFSVSSVSKFDENGQIISLKNFSKVAKAAVDEQDAENKKFEQERLKALDKLVEKYKDTGKTQLQILQDQRDADLKIAKDNQSLKLKIVQKFEQDKAKLQKEAQSKRDQDEANQFQKQQKRLREIENTFKPAFTAFQDILTGNAKGFLSNLPSLVTGVATGVKDLGGNLGKFAGLAGPEAALISQIAGPFLGILSQGKDAVRGAIEEFAAQLPELLTSIIEGLAEAIPAIIEKVPQIIDALVRDLPRIITALAQSMPQVGVQLGLQMPQVAITFATSLIAQAPEIAKAVIKAFTVDAAKGTVKGVGGFFKSIGFAEGGSAFVKQVPSGYNNDTFPARLTSGELVVDRSTASKLKSFLNNSDEMLMAMMTQPILVQVDGRTIAKAVRNQTRQGFVL